jgi:hypothetical protein
MKILDEDELLDEFKHTENLSLRSDDWNTNLIRIVELCRICKMVQSVQICAK